MREQIKETAILLQRAEQAFKELVRDGLTKEELQGCIRHQPEVWSRFAKYLKILPSESKAFDGLSSYARGRLQELWRYSDITDKKLLKEYLETHRGRYGRLRGLGEKTRLELLALCRSSKPAKLFPHRSKPIIFK